MAGSAADGVEADGDTVDLFLLVAGVDEDGHGRGEVVDAVELALGEGAEVPEAGVHLLEGLGEVILVLARFLALGVVEPRPVEARQVLVVGAGAVTTVDALIERLIHFDDRIDDPLRGLSLLDGLAQILELLLLLVEVRLEKGLRQHVPDVVVEAVVLHELVVEIEGDGEAVGDRPLRKAEGAENGHVRRLDAEGSPVLEADLAQGGDSRERGEVPLRRLRLGGPGQRVVVVDLLPGRRPERVAGLSDCVVDVAVDQRVDLGLAKGVVDEGVGNAILNRAQVDVR